MSVARAQREIDSAEFTEWMAYWSIEPFGEERADLRMGILAAEIHNSVERKSKVPRKPADFMPTFGKQTKPQTPKMMQGLFHSFVTQHNRKIQHGRHRSNPRNQRNR